MNGGREGAKEGGRDKRMNGEREARREGGREKEREEWVDR